MNKSVSIEYAPTICPYCSCGCGLNLVVKDGTIIGQEPWKEHPVNEGKNCPKGKHAYEFLYSEDRLKTPLIKKHGTLREASWDEAFEFIASRLKEAKPEEFGFIVSCRGTNEDAYVMQKFTRLVMRTNTVEYCGRLCHSPAAAALIPAIGSGVMQISQLEIELADCIFLAGVNLQETFPLIARRVLRAREKGAKVIYTDPRTTITARTITDIHLPVKSGTDAELINAMMKIILDEELEDKKFISSRTADFDQLRDFLSTIDLNKAAEITGISLKKIREAAITYAKAERGCMLYDQGISEHYTGTDNVRNHANLALLCGHAGKPGSGINPLRGQLNGEGGGDMGTLCVFYPGYKRVNEDSAKFFEKAWGVSGLPDTPGTTYIEMLYHCPYLYIVGADPLTAVPDVNSVRKALESSKLLVVQEMYLTEIAKAADVVLPVATWVETEGTHTWIDRRVQKIEKIVEPPKETKPSWRIICQLADKMGYKDNFNFDSPEQIFEEIRTCVPQYKGITYDRLKNTVGGIHWPCPSEDHPGTPTMFLEKFNTPDGLGHFQAVEFKLPPEMPDKDYPYALTTGRNIFHYHSTLTRRIPKLVAEISQPYVEINPADASKERIKNEDLITLETRRGRIDVHARLTDNVPEGLLFVPIHFPDAPANVLTISALDPASKIAETKLCAAKIEVKS